ncbi:MAG TPA: hypothetical protein VJ508_11220 [Saprospiraceae bacterium]|nr:hypothetical protein [Saprospiraceae bacterium]
MNTKSLVAGLIGGVAFFLLGWLIFGMALANMMASHSNMSCMKPMADMSMPLMVVANLLWGITFGYIFGKAGIAGFSAGATQGAIIAVLIGLTMDLFLYTTTNLYPDFTVAGIDIVANAVVGAIGGGVIGWWLGRK